MIKAMMKGSRAAARCMILLLMASFLILPLSACHGSRGLPEFSIPENYDTAKEYNITFWAKNDTNKTQTEIYEKAIRDFEALYPNIHVNMRLYTDYGRIYNDVITNIATNTTPNVCITYPDHIATYMTGSNVVVPLDALFADGRYGLGGSELRFDGPTMEEIVPEFLSECVLGEEHYAVPYMRSTEACYVNKTFVEKLGYELPETLTWDFVWEVADAAAAQDADGTYTLNGQKVMIPFIYKSTDNMMIQMLAQQNAGYSTKDGEILIFNDTTEAILKEVADHAKKGSFSTFKISSYPANFLNAGQCVFAVDSTAGATWMGSDAPLSDIAEDKIVEFETAVYPVPQYDPAHPKMISQGPSICIFNKKDAGEVLASWLFCQYLLTNDVQVAYSETEGYIPVTKKAQNDAAYQEYLAAAGSDNNQHYPVKIAAAELLMAHTADTFVTPVFNGSTSLRDAAGQMIENVVKSVKRKEMIDDAYMTKLYDDITALYRLDQLGLSTASGGGAEEDLGPLPATAKWLIGILIVVWILLGAAFLRGKILEKKAHR